MHVEPKTVCRRPEQEHAPRFSVTMPLPTRFHSSSATVVSVARRGFTSSSINRKVGFKQLAQLFFAEPPRQGLGAARRSAHGVEARYECCIS